MSTTAPRYASVGAVLSSLLLLSCESTSLSDGGLKVLAATLGLLAACLSVFSAVLSWRASRLKDEIQELARNNKAKEQRIEKLEAFARDCYSVRHQDYNVVLFGPKTAGKTSVATAWSRSWKSIKEIKPTPNYIRHEFIFPEYRTLKDADTWDNGVAHDVHEHARLVIWDYGGEDHLRDKAFHELRSLERCILCMILTAEDKQTRKNDEYFALGFLHGLRDAISARSTFPDVLVLFNKLDLAGSGKRLDALLSDNDNSLRNIRSLFGEGVKSHAVSAQTGDGMVEAMRDLANNIVNEEGHARDRL